MKLKESENERGALLKENVQLKQVHVHRGFTVMHNVILSLINFIVNLESCMIFQHKPSTSQECALHFSYHSICTVLGNKLMSIFFL